jgi:hypothetical protein
MVLLLAAIQSVAVADALFEEATEKINDDPPVYAYTVVTVAEEETQVESFDPSRETGDRWQLISSNGESPSKKQIEKHRKQKEQQRERNRNRGFRKMVDPGSVRMVESTDHEVTYRFKPRIFEDKPEQNEKFVGIVIIRKEDASIRQMEYYNTEEVKPAAVVTVEKLHAVVEFRSLPDGGQVPAKTTTHSKGRAFGFKKFDQILVQEFDNYRKVLNVGKPGS